MIYDKKLECFILENYFYPLIVVDMNFCHKNLIYVEQLLCSIIS